MPDAAYHRAQAELFRHMARHMSRVEDYETALAAAERHVTRARELEDRAGMSSPAKAMSEPAKD
jgi:hypothetical protein